VRYVGNLQILYRDARSTKHKALSPHPRSVTIQLNLSSYITLYTRIPNTQAMQIPMTMYEYYTALFFTVQTRSALLRQSTTETVHYWDSALLRQCTTQHSIPRRIKPF